MKLITYREAAELRGIPRGTLYALVHHNRIPHIRLGRRLVRFSQEALERFVEERTIPVSIKEAKQEVGPE